MQLDDTHHLVSKINGVLVCRSLVAYSKRMTLCLPRGTASGAATPTVSYPAEDEQILLEYNESNYVLTINALIYTLRCVKAITWNMARIDGFVKTE